MNHANLSWTAPEGAESYIWRYRRAPQTWVEEQTTATSATVTGLRSHSGYQFQVAAFGDGITHSQEIGEWSEVKASITALAPKPTRPVEGGKTLNSVSVLWRDIHGVALYQIRTFTTVGNTTGQWIEHTPRPITSSGAKAIGTATGLRPEHSYTTEVRLIGDGSTYVRTVGGVDTPGLWSGGVLVSTKTVPPRKLQGTPGKVGNLPTIRLNWLARSGISRYGVGYQREGTDRWVDLSTNIRGRLGSTTVSGFYCDTDYNVGLRAYSSVTRVASDYTTVNVETTACGMRIVYNSTDPTHVPEKDVLIALTHNWTRSYSSGARINIFNWHDAYVRIRGYQSYGLFGKYADNPRLFSVIRVDSEVAADIDSDDWQGPSYPPGDAYKYGGRYIYPSQASYRGNRNAVATTNWSVDIFDNANTHTPTTVFHGRYTYSLLWQNL